MKLWPIFLFLVFSCTDKKRDKEEIIKPDKTEDSTPKCKTSDVNTDKIRKFVQPQFKSPDERKLFIGTHEDEGADPKVFQDCYLPKSINKNKSNVKEVDDFNGIVLRSPLYPVNVNPVAINFDALKKDIPFLANKSNEEITNWLVSNAGYIMASQVYRLDVEAISVQESLEENISDPDVFNDIMTNRLNPERTHNIQAGNLFYLGKERTGSSGNYGLTESFTGFNPKEVKFGYRPISYGRAALVPFYKFGNNTSEIKGFFDIKGLGSIHPIKWQHGHSDGFLPLSSGLGEVISSVLLDSLLSKLNGPFQVTKIYGLLVYTDIESGSKKSLLIREATNRYKEELEQISKNLDFELLIREYGISSTYSRKMRGGRKFGLINVQGDVTETKITDLGGFKFDYTEFDDTVIRPVLYMGHPCEVVSGAEQRKCLEKHIIIAPGDQGYISKPKATIFKNLQNEAHDKITKSVKRKNFKNSQIIFDQLIRDANERVQNHFETN